MTSLNSFLTTPLYQLHVELGAKLVPFAGYQMPVQYSEGILQEHLHTREQAGLFDVSHMGQVLVSGPSAEQELEALLPIDLSTLAINQQRYSLLTNEQGGVLDDLMICRRGVDDFVLVVNAACKAEDLAYLQNQISADNKAHMLDDLALLALQGPKSAEVLSQLAPELAELPFMHAVDCQLAGVNCFVTRSGYSGEDGFEISLPATEAENLARALLAFEPVAAVGLGARDSLRLEAGLSLYGHELTEHSCPVEAGLGWVIAKSRRLGAAKAGGFPGADKILQKFETGVTHKKVGLRSQERAPVRDGSALHSLSGDQIGEISSGAYSPVAKQPIAMALLPVEFTTPGTEIVAMVRGRKRRLEVVELPFVAHRYV